MISCSCVFQYVSMSEFKFTILVNLDEVLEHVHHLLLPFFHLFLVLPDAINRSLDLTINGVDNFTEPVRHLHVVLAHSPHQLSDINLLPAQLLKQNLLLRNHRLFHKLGHLVDTALPILIRASMILRLNHNHKSFELLIRICMRHDRRLRTEDF